MRINLPIKKPIPIHKVWGIELISYDPETDSFDSEEVTAYIEEQTDDIVHAILFAFPVDEYNFRINYETTNKECKSIIIPYNTNIPQIKIEYAKF